MSITIDDMKMPKSCIACPFEHNGDCYGGKPKRIKDIEDFKDFRHPDCPLIEVKPIVHCKDCKYHEDEELGMVWCPFFIGSWVENDFHCAIGEEKKESMTDKELFEEVFNRFVERYNVIVERPYNNNYVVLKLRSGYVIGEFNYDGYNLLYNLDRLCKVFEYEMR